MMVFAKISNRLVIIEKMASRVMIMGFVSLIIVNVMSRYLWGQPIAFAEELAAILLVWLAFVAISISIAERTQVSVNILVEKLPDIIQKTVLTCVSLTCLVMLSILLWASITWLQSPAMDFEQVISLGWSKLPFFIIIPVFCSTSLIHLICALLSPTKPELVK